VAGGLLAGPRPTVEEQSAVPAPRVPTSFADLMATLESLDRQVLVHPTSPGRYVAYVGRPPEQRVLYWERISDVDE